MVFCKKPIFLFFLFSVIFPNLIFHAGDARAAGFSFTQTAWTGGVTANTATHASNQTGWTEFSDATDVAGAATVTLDSTNYTFTDDGTASVSPSGSATGGDFDSGTNSNTTVTGSGTGASIGLTGTLTAVNTWDSTLAAVPATISTGSGMIRNGTENEIYVMRGGSTGFYKYSISGNSWTTLAVIPGTITDGARMIRNGSEDYIYVTQGGGSTAFYRYSISGNSWTTLAVAPTAIGAGSNMIRAGSEDYIYITVSNGSTGFLRYSISGNSWTTLTASPTAFGTSLGSAMIRNGTDNDIYLSQGAAGGTTGFWKYSISGNSWSTLTSYSGGLTNAGSNMVRGTGEDFIYMTQGNGGTSFERYSISGNSWTTRAVTPAGIGTGSSMIRNGTDNNIYLLRGGSSTSFYRYSISGNSWTTMTAAPASIGAGSTMIRSSSEDEIYVLRGNSATGFYKFVINDTIYPASGTFTSNVIDMAGGADFGTIAYGAGTTLPTGTSVTFDVRAGNTATPDGTWTAYTTGMASGASLNSFDGYRYMQYKINLASSVNTNTPSIDEVDITYSQYPSSGTLTSSEYDSSFADNLITELTWLEADTTSTETVKFQIRSSDDGVTWSTWCGYDDCSGNTYFTTSDGDNGLALDAGHPLQNGSDDRYLQYKIFLTSGGYLTPEVTSVAIDYENSVAPSVTTGVASSITTTVATLGGNITDIGSDDVTVRGFHYGLTDAYGSTQSESGTFSAGAYTLPITGLVCGETYHFRAFATNAIGTTNGSDVTFEASECPVNSSSGSTRRVYVAPIFSNPPAVSPSPSNFPATLPVCYIISTLKYGSRGAEVKCLQKILNNLIVDGMFGPKTKAAVIIFQRNNAPLVPDGIVGPKTRAILLN